MPKASLEFATELYLEQKKTLKRLRGRDDDEILDEIYDAQKRYDDYVRELATKPEIVHAIPDFARNDVGSKNFRVVSWHVVYLSQNLEVFDELSLLSHSDEVYWPSMHVFHLLQEKEADVIIKHLKTKGDNEVAWLMKAADYIQNNRLENHLDLFIRDHKLRYPGFYYTEIAYFNTPECVRLFKEMAENEGYAHYQPWLMQLQIQEGWDSIKAFENVEDEEGGLLAVYSGPEDLALFTGYIDTLPIEQRAPYIETILSFGNIRAMTWLFEQLDSSNAEYRALIFYTMCELFYDEINNEHSSFEQIAEVYEHYEDHVDEIFGDEWDLPMYAAEHLKQLWVAVQPTILSLRNINQRYQFKSNQPFDLLERLRKTRYRARRSDLTALIDHLIVYTGQFFPYDEFAYFDKQEAQLDVWQQFLEENREQFLPGRWVRWGKYID